MFTSLALHRFDLVSPTKLGVSHVFGLLTSIVITTVITGGLMSPFALPPMNVFQVSAGTWI
jgi:uncharacterized membrane protein YjgN (DUF898 family)